VSDQVLTLFISSLEPGFKVPAHQITMPQINMIPHPVTLN